MYQALQPGIADYGTIRKFLKTKLETNERIGYKNAVLSCSFYMPLAVPTSLSKSQSPFRSARITPAPDNLEEAAQKFFTETAAMAAFQERGGMELAEYCKVLGNYLESLRDLMHNINSIPSDEPTPDQSGAQLLHLAVAAWKSTRAFPSVEAEILSALYDNNYPDFSENIFPETAPEWLRIFYPALIKVQTLASSFPSAERICSESANLRQECADIQTQIAEKEKNLAGWRRSAKPETFADQINAAERKVSEMKTQIKALAKKVSDVDPLAFRPATSAVHLKVSAGEQFIQTLASTTRSLEAFLSAIINYQPEQTSEAGSAAASTVKKLAQAAIITEAKFNALHIESNSKPYGSEYTFDKTWLEYLKSSNPAVQVDLLKLLSRLKEELNFHIEIARELKLVDEGSLKAASLPLAQSFTGPQGTAFKIIAAQNPAIHLALAQHYCIPIQHQEKAVVALEQVPNFGLMSWAIKSYWNASSGSDEQKTFETLLSTGSEMAKHVIPLLSQSKKFAESGDISALAKYIDDQILTRSKSDGPIARLAVVLLMDCLASDIETSRSLAHQLPNIELIKTFPGSIAKGLPDTEQPIQKIVHTVLKTYTSSLAAYVQDLEGSSQLWECLDDYQYLIAHPEVQTGVKGNELVKSGVLLIGLPGVGKTFLYECLKTELGLDGHELSPKNKESGSTMLDAVRKIFKAAREAKKPCILFIDEAEALIADRANPRITAEQRELTDYLLQEINDIRIRFPQVLIIAATNFENEIDPAIKRQGRIDYQVELKMPNEKQRQQIIKDTLKKNNVKLELTDEQMANLVNATDSLPPLVLTRTIITFCRVRGPRTGKVLDYELLLAGYKEEKALIQAVADRHKKGGLKLEGGN